MKSDANIYWSKHLADYSFEDKVQVFRQRKCFEAISDRINGSARILEIGPGFTPILDRLSSFHSFLGIEPGELPYSNLVSRYKSDPRVRFVNKSFVQMKNVLSGATFDVIVASGVLGEGGVDPKDFLAMIGQLMGSESVAYINVPNRNSMHRIIGKVAGYLGNTGELSPRQARLGVRELYSLPELCNAIMTSIPSASIIKQGSFFLKPFTHTQLYSAFEAGIIDETVLEGLYQSSEFFPEIGAEIFALFKLSTDSETARMPHA